LKLEPERIEETRETVEWGEGEVDEITIGVGLRDCRRCGLVDRDASY
jgi:hypothetical protein